MNLTDFIPPTQTWIVWAVQAALAVGVISLLAGLLVAVLGKVPFVGPVLASLVRIIGGNYEKWLAERLPKMAEQAVLAVEERYRKSDLPPEVRATEKMREAVELVEQMAPGVNRSIAKAAIESALTRMRSAYMEQKARLN
ncbi:hypothetical protein [Meiothermus hypogaeus]|uniref:Uncharacterized protein n=2 Tax=Meiothermus hypogaeus TaxID=884155 RepID=A0A511R2Q8_9DEIN|nr:hypothetical protein [Meiothermus hypogaeus]RIH76674.1 hypothetical protein Mhypo_02354 [Meiothermus hypogaeus]GEM83900.1 hypothetical protein MHY01S_20660 [Meiothermus hypogaeus NBRC 106114]